MKTKMPFWTIEASKSKKKNSAQVFFEYEIIS